VTAVEIEPVAEYFERLQDHICAALEAVDGSAVFQEEQASADASGVSRPRVLAEGRVFEKAAVHFTRSRGSALPPAASVRRPDVAGRPFEATALSLVVHPRNPFAPTSHANLRFFLAQAEDGAPVWWFGGGFDLTPYYAFLEDVLHWHRTARAACEPFGKDLYPCFKRQCDDYFYLAHRGETRGVGGLFFDDFCEGGFEHGFALVRSIGDHFLPAYLPIVQRREATPYGEREREFQLHRRGRYVEFNLIYDRGTRYGLESGRRVESVLASLPPLVRWTYAWQPAPGSREAQLTQEFLRPRDWLAEGGESAATSQARIIHEAP